jgi:DNA repair protein SbcC/Rad50
MITSVELGNFLSHSSTKLNFEEGVTVFIGQNGAGKSSIIDAITFALFGQHSRKSNKGLIRRGTNQGYSKVNFSINGKSYEAIRMIDSKGNLSAKFLEKQGEKLIPLAVGERKQFGESMTREIEKRIGLDFEKLKIASIVQQGELNSIIKAKPKEFKELLNAIIGIDKLDTASESMKIIQRSFRETIQKKFNFDDTHIEILEKNLTNLEIEIDEAEPQKNKLELKKKACEKEIILLQEKMESESPKEEKLKVLEIQKTDLIKYAKDAILSKKREIDENERKINDCNGCFEFINEKKDAENQLKLSDSEIESISNEIQEKILNIERLKEQKDLARKLKLKNKRCPVCDSKVNSLNPIFQVEHLDKEISSLNEKIDKLEEHKILIQKERNLNSIKIEEAIKAETTLKAHAITNYNELDEIKQKIQVQKNKIQKIPLVLNSGKLIEVSSIDSHAKMLYDRIIKLEKETKGFDPKKFLNLKNSLDDTRRELSEIDQQFGALTKKIQDGRKEITKINQVLKELKIVKQYVSVLEDVNQKIFNRDGLVATSLRSWALRSISEKVSEYLTMLNTKIQRISLSEKTRDVSISCYSRNSVLDLDSLSGGEQVSVALALRLGMAQLLGASNLNFVILDEPTTNLDEQRRKSLVTVLGQLSNISNQNLRQQLQFIIITHDSEIFEDSNVEKIFKFESTEEGTKVTHL